jgi:hypothetical protein
MAKTSKTKGFENLSDPEKCLLAGPGGSTHQTADAARGSLTTILQNSAAMDWVRDAFWHLKVIGHTSSAQPLFTKASLTDDLDEGVIELDARASIGQYIEAANQQRVWDREPRLSGDET